MTNKIITHKYLENLKPKEKQYSVNVDTGLTLLIRPVTKSNPQGSKLWQHRYRINGNRRILSYGKFPEVSLLNVKSIYLESCQNLANGIDPMDLKIEAKLEKQSHDDIQKQERLKKEKYTLKNMAYEWHELNSPDWSPRHRKEVLSSLNRFIFPRLGNTPIADISRTDLMEVFKGIENRPNPPLTALRKLRQRVESIFWYVLDTYRESCNTMLPQVSRQRLLSRNRQKSKI